MHRFFVDPSFINGTSVIISGNEAYHISKVLRLSIGDEVIVCDNKGAALLCRIDTIAKDEVLLSVISCDIPKSEPPIEITLYQGVPKGDKLENIVQKCVELGVSRIVPVAMKRSVAIIKDKAKRGARLNRVAFEAAKQSSREIIPKVADSMTFIEALEDAKNSDLKLLPYEEDRQSSLRAVLTDNKNARTVSVFIGPEGGFEPQEISLSKDYGFKTVGLGPRILRTETAPIACISAIMYEIGDW